MSMMKMLVSPVNQVHSMYGVVFSQRIVSRSMVIHNSGLICHTDIAGLILPYMTVLYFYHKLDQNIVKCLHLARNDDLCLLYLIPVLLLIGAILCISLVLPVFK